MSTRGTLLKSGFTMAAAGGAAIPWADKARLGGEMRFSADCDGSRARAD